MPKGKTPSLIGLSNGRPKRDIVKRASKCSRCDEDLSMGETCYQIPKAGNGFNSARRYCMNCYCKILEQTQKDLEELKSL